MQMSDVKGSCKRIFHPALWVPTAYLAEGIPFAMAIWVTGTMFSNLGHSDTETALVTGSIGIAWSLKPFWAQFLDMFKTKKFFVLVTEILMALILVGMGIALHLPQYFSIIAGMLWLLAFSSATQDICIDGVYITSLDKKQQSAWMGVQGAFWNAGRFFGTWAIVRFAAYLIDSGYDKETAWSYALAASGLFLCAIAIYHYFILPSGAVSVRPKNSREIVDNFFDCVKDFFKKESVWGMLLFIFLYRTGEGFLLVEAPLFMQASIAKGGLGLSLAQKAMLDGTIGTVVSIIGGLLGGWIVSRRGLRSSLLPLALCMNIPHACYIALSHIDNLSLTHIYMLVSLEKLGYSIGFIGNMLYMMQQLAPGKYKMTHYAFATALMNLVLVPTQALSGLIADWLGYANFFIFVLIASIPSVWAAWKAPFPNPPEPEDCQA